MNLNNTQLKEIAEKNEGMKAWVGAKIVQVGMIDGEPCIKFSNGVIVKVDSQIV